MGLEPTNGGTTILCLNHLATPAIIEQHYNIWLVIDPVQWLINPITGFLDGHHPFMSTISIGRASQWIGGMAVLGIGTMLALTNPGPTAYHRYAAKTVSLFVMRDICQERVHQSEMLKSFALEGCQSIAAQGETAILSFIQNNTDHQNFILFSLYTTELPVRSLRILGIFNRFFIVS